MLARDQADPEKTGTATVIVVVRRDLQAPRFEGEPYRATVAERAPVGTAVSTLRGRDDDRMVLNLMFTFTSHV